MNLWLGNIGVEIFFILSGYLIATVLSRKEGFFYFKRIMRIFPVYFFYLIICILLTGSPVMDYLLPLTFTTNLEDLLARPVPAGTSHFWTLAIEEQFYLLSPLLLLLKTGRILKVLFFLLTGFFVFEAFWFQYPAEASLTWGRSLPVLGFFGILNGILVTTHFFRNRFYIYYAIGLIGVYILLFITLPVNKNLLLPLFSIGFSFLFQHLTSARTFVNRILENKLLVALGTISYSFYVFHPLVLQYASRSSYTGNFLVAFCLTAVVATAIYWGIERPVLILRRHIIKPA